MRAHAKNYHFPKKDLSELAQCLRSIEFLMSITDRLVLQIRDQATDGGRGPQLTRDILRVRAEEAWQIGWRRRGHTLWGQVVIDVLSCKYNFGTNLTTCNGLKCIMSGQCSTSKTLLESISAKSLRPISIYCC